MTIKTLTHNLYIKNLEYKFYNVFNKTAEYSNKCKVSILL